MKQLHGFAASPAGNALRQLTSGAGGVFVAGWDRYCQYGSSAAQRRFHSATSVPAFQPVATFNPAIAALEMSGFWLSSPFANRLASFFTSSGCIVSIWTAKVFT